MEEKYNGWQEKFADIKENKLTVIDDMLIDLDVFVDKRDYKNCGYRIAKIELEIYKVREAANNDLNIIFGAIKNENLTDEVIVTVIATGFDDNNDDEVKTKSDDVDMQQRRSADDDLDIPSFLRNRSDF